MQIRKRSKLALLGGERTIPKGYVKPWPPIGEIDKKYVLKALEGPSHTYGPNCTALEKDFARWNGNRFAILTNSGTAALHMAVAACGCGTGDEVIVPAYSWSSSVTCILHHNAIPVFVDIDYKTMNIDTDKIEAAITPKTKAILVVHLHGLAVNMEKVCRIARKHNLKVIEDACQSHGAEFKGKKVGLWGDCGGFSLNHNKCLTSGEGGIFVTDDEEMLNTAKMLWSFGEDRKPNESRDYHAYALGWMYRSSELVAGFGRAQLTKLDSYLKIQEENAHVLLEGIKDIKGLIPPYVPKGHKHIWYNLTMHIDAKKLGYEGKDVLLRDAILKALDAEGTQCNIWQRYILPAMTVFQAKNAYGKGCPWTCPNTRKITYNPKDYPVAQKHCDTHFGMTMPLRAPNNTRVAKLLAEAFVKVFDNLKELGV
ncbi:MAG TPA: DegT/DnrJ/EryC1/StrS family aminotransferase [bacterium]|nr:DegT/DnrJ/EryC1/StrS family aminotransferase [bacterium]